MSGKQLELSKHKQWGGKREGSGRKRIENKLACERTKVIRVREDLIPYIKEDKLEAILSIIDDWNEQSDSASKSSPRWSKARELLDELNSAIN